MSFRHSRRRFLLGLAATLGALAAGRPPRLGLGPLAGAYAALVPQEADPARLAALLTARLGRPVERAGVRAFATAIREDFARGDTVRLQGWILARTECRLALWRELT